MHNLQYFIDEMLRFRDYIGRRDTSLEQRQRALVGFAFVYVNTVCKDEVEEKKLVDIFLAATIEYEKRESFRLLVA